MPRHRRIHRHNDTPQLGRHIHRAPFQPRTGPKRTFGVLHQNTVQLLPPQPRARISRLHLGQKRRRQIGTVRIRRRVGHNRAVAFQQLLQHAHIPRRGRHTNPRIIAQPQPELQHVPRVLCLFPLGHFIHPRAVKLRATQAFGIIGGKHHRLGPVRPTQTLAPRDPVGPTIRRRTGQNATIAKHHHLAHLINGFPHQRHARTAPLVQGLRPFNLRPDPFRSRTRFARATPPHNHPRPPVTLGW